MNLNSLYDSNGQPLGYETWIDRSDRHWKFEWIDEEGNLDCYGYPVEVNGTLSAHKAVLHCWDHIPEYMSCPKSYRDDKYGTIVDIEVHPSFRGAGVGSELVTRALDWMRSRGCNGCWGRLSAVDDICSSKPFWESFGFDVQLTTEIKPWVGIISMAFD